VLPVWLAWKAWLREQFQMDSPAAAVPELAAAWLAVFGPVPVNLLLRVLVWLTALPHRPPLLSLKSAHSKALIPVEGRGKGLLQAKQHKTAYAGSEACCDSFLKANPFQPAMNSGQNTKRNTPLTLVARLRFHLQQALPGRATNEQPRYSNLNSLV
jgi:hypothetical protein